MIRHAALFKLHHAAGSEEEKVFLDALAALSDLPGVQKHKVTREIHPDSPYDFEVSMYFEDQAAFDAYMVDPIHMKFGEEHWVPSIAVSLEHDTVPMN
jgi:heme-degrading monooxygenase HmoA